MTHAYLTGYIQTLERVQRRATKLVPKLKHLGYIDRFTALNLPSLSTITVFKIVHGLQGVPFSTLVFIL